MSIFHRNLERQDSASYWTQSTWKWTGHNGDFGKEKWNYRHTSGKKLSWCQIKLLFSYYLQNALGKKRSNWQSKRGAISTLFFISEQTTWNHARRKKILKNSAKWTKRSTSHGRTLRPSTQWQLEAAPFYFCKFYTEFLFSYFRTQIYVSTFYTQYTTRYFQNIKQAE